MTRPATTLRITAAEAVLRFFAAQHSERDAVERPLVPAVLGIFGHGNAAGMGYALAQGNTGLGYFQGKNEQGMVHTAIGFAKANQRLSTLAVTTSIGPGATNLVTGAATATVNRIPVLLLPGDVFSRRRQGPVLQQLELAHSFDVSVNDTLRPVSRYFDRITRPEQLVESLPQAAQALVDDSDTGAVTLALCQDTQSEAFDFPSDLFERRVHNVVRRPPAGEAVGHAARLIAASTRPMLVAGGGVRYSAAEAALVRFSDSCGVPVGETFAGRGSARNAVLCAGGMGFIGSAAANALATEADLVIAVGSRLADTVTGSRSLFQHPTVRFIALNTSDFDATKMGALGVLGDARCSLEALIAALASIGWQADRGWSAHAADVIKAWSQQVNASLDVSDEQLRGYQVVDELAKFVTADDRVVMASSTAIGYAHSFWDRRSSGPCEFEYGYSCMGHEIPAAFGYRLARPSVGDVYAVVGDGTYLMGNTGELVTAVQEGSRFTTIVLVNEGYQCIRQFEAGAFGSEFGTQFRKHDNRLNYEGDVVSIDYAANAASLGCKVADVSTRAALLRALAETRSGSVPIVIAAHISDEPFPVPAGAWWDFGFPEIQGDSRVNERRAEYLRGQALQRWYT